MAKRKKQASGVSKVLLVILGIVIVGILTGYYFVKKEVVEPVQQNMTTAEGKARDATRKAALRSYVFELEVYSQSVVGNYPVSASCISPQDLNKQLDKKVNNPPKEPFRDQNYTEQDNSWPDFCYQSDSTGTKFTIWTKLENSSDDKTSQINTTPYYSVPTGFEPNYYFMQSEE